MERQIRRLGLAFVVLLIVLFAQVNYLQVFAASDIANNPANAKRQLIAEYKVQRGSILARDASTVLAFSRTSSGELRYLRRYPDGSLYAHVTGYYSLIFGRRNLEQSYNSFLSGDAPQLLPSTLADLVLGRPKRGARLITTIDPAI